ncbi:hypothetical protein B0H16DRAFT_1504889, partial [Mycena metata]
MFNWSRAMLAYCLKLSGAHSSPGKFRPLNHTTRFRANQPPTSVKHRRGLKGMCLSAFKFSSSSGLALSFFPLYH